MNIKAAGAFWKLPHSSYPEPYLIAQYGDARVFGLATGSESGFDYSPHLAHDVLTYILNLLCGASALSDLEAAFEKAQEYLAEKYTPDDLAVASCTLLVGVLSGNQLQLGWLGGEEAYLIRQGHVVKRTIGDTITNTYPDKKFPDFMAFYPLKYLSADNRHFEVSSESWIIQPGDCVVFLTAQVFRNIKPETIAPLIASKTAEQAAQALINVSSGNENRSGMAALVVQIM